MHVLLTVLGKRTSEANYALNGKVVTSDLAPLALIELLGEVHTFDKVYALCTKEAKATVWPKLEKTCPVVANPIDVPDGAEQDDIDTFLQQILGSLPTDQPSLPKDQRQLELTIDVTHGFRHFSFLMYMAALYLSALDLASVRGAYYGLLHGGADGTSPFLDLKPLLEFPQWLHGIQELKETGSARAIVQILEGANSAKPASQLIKVLGHLSEAYLSGLPLELGHEARSFLKKSRKNFRARLRKDHRLPLAERIGDQLAEIVKPFAFDEPEPKGNPAWKSLVTLSEVELKRQAQIIDDLLDRGNYATALGLMDEWTVSWGMLQQERNTEWLDFRSRQPVAARLRALAMLSEDQELGERLTDRQRQLGRFWRRLSELRNGFAHHGMRAQSLLGSDKSAKPSAEHRKGVCDFWCDTLRYLPNIALEITGSHTTVLVTPMGKSAGALFSALSVAMKQRHVPTLSLVLCSKGYQDLIHAAKKQACFTGNLVELPFEDALGGVPELDGIGKRVRPHVIGATEILVNLTGGTTLLGLAASAAAQEATKLGIAIRRFGLIDPRPPAEQANAPFHQGRPVWLDELPNGSHWA